MPVKQHIGIVTSNKMIKSIVIKVENKYPHPLYSKTLTKTKKYLVHDELNIANVGDKVLIKECRPISKKKCWQLVQVILKSSILN